MATVKKEELKRDLKVWCWWKSRSLYYTGVEGYEKGYNLQTKDYTPRHYYRFRDVCGAVTRIYDEDLEKLMIK